METETNNCEVLCSNCSEEGNDIIMKWYWTSKDGIYMRFRCGNCGDGVTLKSKKE